MRGIILKIQHSCRVNTGYFYYLNVYYIFMSIEYINVFVFYVYFEAIFVVQYRLIWNIILLYINTRTDCSNMTRFLSLHLIDNICTVCLTFTCLYFNILNLNKCFNFGPRVPFLPIDFNIFIIWLDFVSIVIKNKISQCIFKNIFFK